MNKNFLILFFAFLTSGLGNAQVNLLNAKSVDQIGEESLQQLAADNDGPIPCYYNQLF